MRDGGAGWFHTGVADEAHEHIRVAATPARCYEVATSFEHYPDWARDVKDVTVLQRDGDGRGSQVEFRVAGLGQSIRYVLEYDYADAPGAFSWRLVESDKLRGLEGRYGFEADGDGTRVAYDLAIDVAIPLPGLIKRQAARMIVATALKELKHESERPPP